MGEKKSGILIAGMYVQVQFDVDKVDCLTLVEVYTLLSVDVDGISQ